MEATAGMRASRKTNTKIFWQRCFNFTYGWSPDLRFPFLISSIDSDLLKGCEPASQPDVSSIALTHSFSISVLAADVARTRCAICENKLLYGTTGVSTAEEEALQNASKCSGRRRRLEIGCSFELVGIHIRHPRTIAST